jgi:hypothetical protein
MIILDHIGPVEDEIVKRVHARLKMGQEQYGKLSLHDGRAWRREALEEVLDAAVYMVIDEMEDENND